jgi:Family of unknown function (DUF6493)
MGSADLAVSETELEKLCREGQVEKLKERFGSTSRLHAQLAPTALKLFKELVESGPEQRRCAALAVLLTVSNQELARLHFWPGIFGQEILTKDLLKSLPLERLQIFSDQLLQDSPFHLQTIEALANDGLITVPQSNSYVAALIAGVSWPNKNKAGLDQTLRNRPDFLKRDVWLLFKWDGSAENCLASADKYLTNAAESWQSVLVNFANEGTIDRNRLLDESLIALTRDFNQFRAGWFSRFHKELAPNKEERMARTAMYLALLNSAVTSTVSFAVSMLVAIDKDRPLHFEEIENHLMQPLGAKAKQTVSAALQLLENCAKREPLNSGQICLLACTALSSEQAEIQRRVLKLLAKHGDANDEILTAAFSAYAGGLAASSRAEVPGWLTSRLSESDCASNGDNHALSGDDLTSHANTCAPHAKGYASSGNSAVLNGNNQIAEVKAEANNDKLTPTYRYERTHSQSVARAGTSNSLLRV